MPLLKLNFKCFVRYFKTGIIHDNNMKLEEFKGTVEIDSFLSKMLHRPCDFSLRIASIDL